MDITPQDTTQQPISDDQELAKALAGVMPDAPEPETPATDAPADTAVPDPMQFEETPAPVAPASMPAVTPAAADPAPAPAAPSTDLDSIRNSALSELRPLLDKVDMPAEEKFDTYLLILRSTDDKSLVGPAHAAAQAITDEKRKAEALLDIIKEIDYLSHGDQQPAA